jgi:hypothetical protein
MRAANLAIALCCLAMLGLLRAAAGQDLRDPTRPPHEEHAREAVLEQAPVVSAVLTFEGKRTAIFNGRLVHDGSVVGDYTIDQILADGVRYRRAHEVHEAHLPRPASSMKQPAAEPVRAPNGVEP